MTIDSKQYKEYMRLKEADQNGLNLPPHTLMTICKAFDNDAWQIGNWLLETLNRLRIIYPRQFDLDDIKLTFHLNKVDDSKVKFSFVNGDNYEKTV